MAQFRNFQVVDTQTLSVTTSNSTGVFTTTSLSWNQATSCIIENTGTALALLVFAYGSAPTAPNAAPYGNAIPIPAGAIFTVNKDLADNFAAICPTGSTTLWLSAGFGN